ncbi:30S ribosomal protein S9 [Anaerolineales bacterium HSG6]|nr:30S ribosomal protein S9 [Anaerolineales bacterium HSG6]MDM8530060.1 30S ribosomal protein S9 [Anaerolineales bacterium HSG25]
MADTQYFEGVGRRKASTARVRLYPNGDGEFTVNNKTLENYLARSIDQVEVNNVFKVTGTQGQFDVSVKVSGGGVTGQTDSIRLGIARALLKVDPENRKVLRKHGLLTRDDRVKERKKPGLKRARKAPQYTKR